LLEASAPQASAPQAAYAEGGHPELAGQEDCAMFLDSLPLDQVEHWLVTWGFEGEAFDTLKSYAEEISFPARATIFSQGDPSDGMYLVLEGMALVIKTNAEGVEETVSIVTEGQSFGELGLLVGQPRLATVAAGLDVRLLKITPGMMDRLEKERPELMLRLYKALAQTLAEQWMRAGQEKPQERDT
jgi:signal-transduction protein with cAMP-binding, CBS, and nucleotidyltransferase domain